MPSSSPPQSLNPVKPIASGDSFDGTGSNMSFVETSENLLIGVFDNCVGKVLYLFGSYKESVGFCYSGQNLFLLELVIEDRDFFSFRIFELPAEQGIPNDDDGRFSEVVG